MPVDYLCRISFIELKTTPVSSQDKIVLYETLKDSHAHFDLPVFGIDERAGFTIHNLHDAHAELPYKSPVFRANYFSFAFVKDGVGKYTTDEQEFNTQPGTIYF